MTYPGILFWLFVIWAAASRGPMIYYLFFACWSLGTLAVIPPQLAQGNFTPAWVVAGLLTVRVVMEAGPKRYFSALVDPHRFGALSLCTLYAAASAVLLPRLFEGRVKVVEVRLLNTADPVALAPNGANINQSLYFILTTLIVVNAYFICRDPQKRRQFLSAFAWGGVIAVGTGILDLLTSKAGLGGLLAPFRNAAYAIMADNDALSMHRIIGLMSEASSFASLCLPFLSLIVLVPRDAGAPWRRWALPLSVALMVITYLSTSSSGYVSLIAVGVSLVLSLAIGMALRKKTAWRGASALVFAATVGCAILLFTPAISDALYHVIDAMVLQKSHSDSYAARSAWNAAAWQAFIGTDFLGAGTGSARASSWELSVLSNIGLPGSLLLLLFMGQALLSRAEDVPDRRLARAAKLALIPNLLMISLSGTTMTFGPGVAVLFGLMTGLAWADPEPRARQAAKAQSKDEATDRASRQIFGVFVDPPLHALLISSTRRVPVEVPRPQLGPPSQLQADPAGIKAEVDLTQVKLDRPRRSKAFRRMVDRMEEQVPEGLFIHVIVYSHRGQPKPRLDRWIAGYPRWSFELYEYEQIVTGDWLHSVDQFVTSEDGGDYRKREPRAALDLHNAIEAHIATDAKRFSWTISQGQGGAAAKPPRKARQKNGFVAPVAVGGGS